MALVGHPVFAAELSERMRQCGFTVAGLADRARLPAQRVDELVSGDFDESSVTEPEIDAIAGALVRDDGTSPTADAIAVHLFTHLGMRDAATARRWRLA